MMPKNSKFKKAVFHKTQTSFFYDSKNFALPRFPTVYQLDLPKQKFTKQYDCLYELYFERDRLLERDDLFLYNYLQSLANRGLIMRLKDFSSFVEMDYHKLIERFDRLEDCFLIHRVNRLDLHGKPNDLIVHLPATPEQWKGDKFNPGMRERIIKRLEIGSTRQTRTAAGIEKETAKGFRRFIPRTNGKFFFDYKETFRKTFPNENDAETFAKSILKHFYTAKAEIIKDVKKFDNDLRQMVKDSFKARDQRADEKHYKAALTMRKIYAPVISEF